MRKPRNRRPGATLCITAALLALPVAACRADMLQAPSLTGLWLGDDGAVYYMRQIGSAIWWAAFNPDPFNPASSEAGAFQRGLSSTHVFQGVVSGSALSGEWAEVPRQTGFVLHQGTLAVQIVESPSGGVTLHRTDQTGGFAATNWTQAGIPALPCTDKTGKRDPYCLFSKVLKNQTEAIVGSHESLLDNLKPYKDNAVIFGTVADPYTLSGTSVPANCSDFFANHSADDDLNFDIIADRANLDAQPGFWTNGWVNSAPNIQAKLSAGNNWFHCETIAYGRQDSQCLATSPSFLPGWGEPGANGSLWQGLPIAGDPIVSLYGNSRVAPSGSGLPMRAGSSVRVTGVVVLDCGHGLTSPCSETDASTQNQEIHPVYSVDVLQDFTKARPQNIDLSGSWGASDAGTYYVSQSGNTIWWLGLSSDQGITFANVFHGTISKILPIATSNTNSGERERIAAPPNRGGPNPIPLLTVISGQWASVPLGSQQSDGSLTLSGAFCANLNLPGNAVPCDSTQPVSAWNSLNTQSSTNPIFGNPPNQGFAWQKLFDRDSAPEPRISSPGGIVLGTVANGSEVTTSFEITNVGTAPLSLTSITTNALGAQVSPKTATIQPGAAAVVSLRMLAFNRSASTGTASATVTVASNDPSAPVVAVPVQVTVRGSPPQ
jgi:hypothetical protein